MVRRLVRSNRTKRTYATVVCGDKDPRWMGIPTMLLVGVAYIPIRFDDKRHVIQGFTYKARQFHLDAPVGDTLLVLSTTSDDDICSVVPVWDRTCQECGRLFYGTPEDSLCTRCMWRIECKADPSRDCSVCSDVLCDKSPDYLANS